MRKFLLTVVFSVTLMAGCAQPEKQVQDPPLAPIVSGVNVPESCEQLATARTSACTAWDIYRCGGTDDRFVVEYDRLGVREVARLLNGRLEIEVAQRDGDLHTSTYLPSKTAAEYDPMVDSGTIKLGGDWVVSNRDGSVRRYTRKLDLFTGPRDLEVSGRQIKQVVANLTYEGDATGADRIDGRLFYDPLLGSVVGFIATQTWTADQIRRERDYTPTEIYLPGQSGFADHSYLASCTVQ